MVSKKQLIRELEGYRDALMTLADAVHRHVDEATKLGHEAEFPLPTSAPTSSAFALDRLRLLELADVNALQADNAELRAKLAAAEEAAAEKRVTIGVDYATPARAEIDVRRETLEKVIEALDLDEYRDGDYFFYPLFSSGRERGADRFWADITTALRVRAEDAEAEADEAAEARIAAIIGARRAADQGDADGETILSSNGGDQ